MEGQDKDNKHQDQLMDEQQTVDEVSEVELTERQQIQVLLFNEWFQRVTEDGMFEDEENSSERREEESDSLSQQEERVSNVSINTGSVSPVKSIPLMALDTKKIGSGQKLSRSATAALKSKRWIIDSNNLREFIEAINVQTYIELEEFNDIVEASPGQKLTFREAVDKLAVLLIDEKKIPFQSLVNQHFSIPADRILKFLKILKTDLQAKQRRGALNQVEALYLQESQYALSKINKREMFTSTEEVVRLVHLQQRKLQQQQQQLQRASLLSAQGPGKKKNRLSMRLQWMNEFSDVGSEVMSSNTINMLKAGSAYLDYKDIDHEELLDSGRSGERPSSASLHFLMKKHPSSELQDKFAKYDEYLEGAESLSFDAFKFCENVGRHNVLSLMTTHGIHIFELHGLIDESRAAKFLSRAFKTYRQEVTYHNDFHGADVLQMGLYMLTTCGLQKTLRLNKLDCLSFIIAAACHDLGHDGFTNTYHVNAITRRAIDSNDVSVQESFHVSELFRILRDPNYEFTHVLTTDEFKIFRKRVLGIILATDMARHVADLSQLNGLLSDSQIKDGENIDKLFEGKDQSEQFKVQQFLMEMAVHACDISQQARRFDMARNHAYSLFIEFFNQGDLEKEQSLPVSLLCDRTSTSISNSQPGFISFVTPLFQSLTNIMPNLQEAVDGLKSNAKQYAKYEETKEDRKIYEKMEKPLMPDGLEPPPELKVQGSITSPLPSMQKSNFRPKRSGIAIQQDELQEAINREGSSDSDSESARGSIVDPPK